MNLFLLLSSMNPAEPGLYYFPSFYFLIPSLRVYGINNWFSLSLYNEYVNRNMVDSDADKQRLLSQLEGNTWFLWGLSGADVLLNFRGFYLGVSSRGGVYFDGFGKDLAQLILYGNDQLETTYQLYDGILELGGYLRYYGGFSFRIKDYVLGFNLGYVQMAPYLRYERIFLNFYNGENELNFTDTLSFLFMPGGSGITSDLGILYEPAGKGWFIGFHVENLFSSINLTNRPISFLSGLNFDYVLDVRAGYYVYGQGFVDTSTVSINLNMNTGVRAKIYGNAKNINLINYFLNDRDTALATFVEYEYLNAYAYKLPTILYLDFGYRDIANTFTVGANLIYGLSESFISTRKPKIVAWGTFKILPFLLTGLKAGFGGRERFELGLMGGLDFRYWFLDLGWNWSRGFFSSAKGHRIIAQMGFKSPLKGKLNIKVVDSLTNEPLIAKVEILDRKGKLKQSRSTKDDGTVEFLMDPEKYSFHVSATHYVPVKDTFTVVPKRTINRVVKLVPEGGFLRIVVLDEKTGDTLRGVRVLVRDSVFNYDGGILEVFVRKGDVDVSAYKEKYKDYASVVSVDIGQKVEHVIRMKPALSELFVKVMDAKTKDPLEANIYVISEKGDTVKTALAETLKVSLDEGNYRLEVRRKGYNPFADVVVARAGEDIFKEILLRKVEPEAGELIARVKDALTDEMLVGASIFVISDKGDTTARGLTDEKGTFRTKLLKGSYNVVASMEGYFPAQRSIFVEKKSLVDITLSLRTKFGIVYGLILDREKGNRVKARIEVIDSADNVLHTFESDSYYVKLMAGKYRIRVKAEGYVMSLAEVEVVSGERYRKDFLLLKEKQVLTFRNIYFDFNKATIRPESYPVLDSIAQMLKENPNIIVEVAGHTDERGSEEYNLKLSQARAEAVVNYLIRKGIDPSRLIPKGYGESQPIIRNAKTEREHQINRRVEFRILREIKEE